MRVDELQLKLAFDSHPLSSTLIDFELVQILMRVDESLCAFDQSTLINSHNLRDVLVYVLCGINVRLIKVCGSLFIISFIFQRFSHTSYLISSHHQ